MHINRRPSWFLGDLDLWPQFHVSRSNQHPQKPRTRHQNKDSSYKGWEVMIISVWAKTQKAAIFNLCNFEVVNPRIKGVNNRFWVRGVPKDKIGPVAFRPGGCSKLPGRNSTISIYPIFRHIFLFIREINRFLWENYKNFCILTYSSI